MWITNKPMIGLALWSWWARGMSHIWVIQWLKEIWIEPDIVCWTSIWALVWASYLNNNLWKLSSEFSELNRYELLKFFKPKITKNSYVDINKFQKFFIKNVCEKNKNIDDISKKFWCIATDYDTWEEIKFTKGNIMDSVFSSIALPWLFDPFLNDDKLLIDWGIVNPVPVSLCKKLWADIVIAVNLNSVLLDEKYDQSKKSDFYTWTLLKKIREKLSIFFPQKEKKIYPSIFESSSKAIDIMQCTITKHNILRDNPDILLEPKVGNIWVIDFYKYDHAIKKWKETVKNNKENILEKINNFKKETK